MSDLAAALQIAIKVHADQCDKQGQPYLLHVLRVVEAVSDEAKVVAALHDVVEDSDQDVMGLGKQLNLSRREQQALALLTRGDGESYTGYIAQLSDEGSATWTDQKAFWLAREVKLADLTDNLGRIPPEPFVGHPVAAVVTQWRADWEPLKRRYEKAIATLEATQ